MVILNRLRTLLGRVSSDITQQVCSHSPHSILLYQFVLEDLLANPSVRFIQEEDIQRPLPEGETVVSLRHDIDGMPDNLKLLLNVERHLGLRSINYVLLNNAMYNAHSYREEFLRWQSEGFEFGLHTTAPASDKPMQQFSEECQLFFDIFGHNPKYFTIHGVNPHPDNWPERRVCFNTQVNQSNSLKMAPCSQFFDNISWVEDSRSGGIFGYLRRNFFMLPDVGPGLRIVLLTHPEHWCTHPYLLDTNTFRKTWRAGVLAK